MFPHINFPKFNEATDEVVVGSRAERQVVGYDGELWVPIYLARFEDAAPFWRTGQWQIAEAHWNGRTWKFRFADGLTPKLRNMARAEFWADIEACGDWHEAIEDSRRYGTLYPEYGPAGY